MCGIVGTVALHPAGFEHAIQVINSQLRQIEMRGPDSSGIWINNQHCVALGHQRLAIVDLSEAGHQPMASADGRYIIVFNGEIYNHLEIRDELRQFGVNQTWRGHSDTETFIAAISAWGISNAVQRSVGMFAFAVFDLATRNLTLGRDRFGEKPLYYGEVGSGNERRFVFGSDIRAISELPDAKSEKSSAALGSLFQIGYIPAPHTIYEGVYKLTPGTLLTFNPDTMRQHVETYWDAISSARAARESPFLGNDTEAVSCLETILSNSIAGQMVSDVPLGAFLSGGVDSTCVVALMSQLSSRKVKTFSIGFHDKSFDEAKYAKETARHFGTDHTEHYLSEADGIGILQKIPDSFCEPFGDSSQIPTLFVAQLAKSHVSVSLSGDGGDELFGGYNRHLFASSAWQNLQRIPLPLRNTISTLLGNLSLQTLNNLGQLYSTMSRGRSQVSNFAEKANKIIRVLGADGTGELYRRSVSFWHPTVMEGYKAQLEIDLAVDELSPHSASENMMLLDTVNYLPGDILNKVDRACMAFSLEGRIPFLDHRVYEFAWSLPMHLKIRNGETKWILRKLLDRYVPRAMMTRPKMGFAVPLADWLRGPLRPWAEELLSETKLRDIHYLDVTRVRACWQIHLSGRSNMHEQLWPILMYQNWLGAQK